MIHSEVTDQPIDVTVHEGLVADAACGAVVSFAGVVRDHDDGKPVARLTYEGHPDASRILGEIAGELAASPGVASVAVSHRVGDLAIGDAALVAAVSGPHRAEVFAACARLVDEVKARLPIWKHQLFDDGTDEWVNSP
ncbi:MAG TPA: molybdenum cofactor biosynthesis protein MoaE [Stackebrandtia sp.]|uniref:molybdenum cofactor biosynthesis protein MoaE n=1 Tax=Stackebrandtia sp. TaxID=2023065 RepID=UPI002D58053F|nr:molybdenum cofactor biosynthesis protein MoaE [Stackebrandtia sp.]HZE41168.1 molybdenum cofactor biosynthesis protein MoaE [Stackebrandtia sp.]